MLDLVSDVGCSNIVVEAIRVVLNYDLCFIFTLILPLYELFL